MTNGDENYIKSTTQADDANDLLEGFDYSKDKHN